MMRRLDPCSPSRVLISNRSTLADYWRSTDRQRSRVRPALFAALRRVGVRESGHVVGGLRAGPGHHEAEMAVVAHPHDGVRAMAGDRTLHPLRAAIRYELQQLTPAAISPSDKPPPNTESTMYLRKGRGGCHIKTLIINPYCDNIYQP
eukprot:1709862-Pyramimonas_sp.AAC.2